MKCYFADFTKPSTIVAFTIPDLGFVFKASMKGYTPQETAYASLLALLEFREQNPNLFGREVLEVFGDNLQLICQVTGRMLCSSDLMPYLKMVLGYKTKIPFVVNFIPKEKNPVRVNYL